MDNAQSNLGTYISSIDSARFRKGGGLHRVATAPEAARGNSPRRTFPAHKTDGENFLASFYKDYDSVGLIVDENAPDEAEKTVLDVWISRGTEWGEILKELADEDFTPKTGIVVNLHVLPSGQLATGADSTLSAWRLPCQRRTWRSRWTTTCPASSRLPRSRGGFDPTRRF